MAKSSKTDAPKKPRGRPRKHPAPDPDAPKRPPGRPRKDTPPEGAGPPTPPPPIDPDAPPAPDPNDPAARELTYTEQRYVDEYMLDRKRVRAYRRVFPNANYRTAANGVAEIHNRPHVLREIQEATRAQQIRTQIRADTVLKELRRIAESDVLDLFDPQTNQLRHPRHIPIDTRRTIASIRVNRARTTVNSANGTQTSVVDTIMEYKLWNKNDALGKLAAYLGLQTEIPPLDALLSALPPALASAVRSAMLQQAQPPQPKPPEHPPTPAPDPQPPAEEAPK